MKDQIEKIETSLLGIVLRKKEPYLMTGQDRVYVVIPKDTTETTYTASIRTEDGKKYLEVTFELSTKLKAMYPCCIVKIDNKNTTLGTLEQPVRLKYGVTHEIVIEWKPGRYIESFRIPIILEEDE